MMQLSTLARYMVDFTLPLAVRLLLTFSEISAPTLRCVKWCSIGAPHSMGIGAKLARQDFTSSKVSASNVNMAATSAAIYMPAQHVNPVSLKTGPVANAIILGVK